MDDPELKRDVTEAALRVAKARTAALTTSVEAGVEEAAREEWVQAQPTVVAAEVALGEATSALEEATVAVTFRALPRPVWTDLLGEHAPTEAQADAGHEYNVETFPAALVSASSVDGMSEEEAQELLDGWSEGDARALFTAAMTVNQTIRADLGKG
ncbi:hypothetical protein ACIQXD_29635 [Streptomyces uncialis]|uniref:hypothetical protein n=1 Tax=Streptomyces uncialis TaxID=1048205 RepID=UPI00380632DA